MIFKETYRTIFEKTNLVISQTGPYTAEARTVELAVHTRRLEGHLDALVKGEVRLPRGILYEETIGLLRKEIRKNRIESLHIRSEVLTQPHYKKRQPRR